MDAQGTSFLPSWAVEWESSEFLETLPDPERAVVYTLCLDCFAFLGDARCWKGRLCDGCFNGWKVPPLPDSFSPHWRHRNASFQWIFKEPIVCSECWLLFGGRGGNLPAWPAFTQESMPSPAVERGTPWLLTWTVRMHESEACEGLKNNPQQSPFLHVICCPLLRNSEFTFSLSIDTGFGFTGQVQSLYHQPSGWEDPDLTCLGKGNFPLTSSRNCLSNPHHSRWQIAKQREQQHAFPSRSPTAKVKSRQRKRALTCKRGLFVCLPCWKRLPDGVRSKWARATFSWENHLWRRARISSGKLGLAGEEPRVHAQLFIRVWLSVTPWTVAGQAPLSMGFSRQE